MQASRAVGLCLFVTAEWQAGIAAELAMQGGRVSTSLCATSTAFASINCNSAALQLFDNFSCHLDFCYLKDQYFDNIKILPPPKVEQCKFACQLAPSHILDGWIKTAFLSLGQITFVKFRSSKYFYAPI